MLNKDIFVIDATVHAFNFLPSNYQYEWLPELTRWLYNGATRVFAPPDDPKWLVSYEQFIGAFDYYPALLPETLFGESPIDVAVYHGVPLEGVYRDGSSPLWVAERVREQYPGRLFLYGPLYPWREDAFDELERLVEEVRVIGLKFYPLDCIDGELKPTRMDDERTFRVVERARALGLKMMAIHKAVPLGPLPADPYQNVSDCAPIISAFPDLTFEIVHGGIAYLRETVDLIERYPNVAINLEGTASFTLQMQAQFAEVMHAFLSAGAARRMFFSSAAMGGHPRPVVEQFWNFEMPAGLQPLTEENKRDILGRNYARYLGWDLTQLAAAHADDKFARQEHMNEPWAYLRRYWRG
jgi:hypothetical protein